MLQWMGGSRKKVTTSRKSTQKRQKQYFEQRKRQQQQEQTAGLESYTDGLNMLGKHYKEHRSLDVQSFLSATAQTCNPSCLDGKEDSEVNGSTVNHHIRRCQPTGFAEFDEARTLSGYQEETASPKKVLFNAPDSHGNTFSGDGSKSDHWKTTEHQLSILDLLGDNGHNGNSDVNPVHEDHVAFSIEGLGKMGSETPAHSPQQPSRILSYGYSSSLKAARRLQSSKKLRHVHDDLQLELDAMVQDISMPHSDSCMELPSYSRGKVDSFDNPTQNLPTCEDCTQLYGHSSKVQNSFSNEKIFTDNEDGEDNKWKARSSFLDDNLLDEREYNTSWKNWPCQMESNYGDCSNFGNNEMSDFDFEGPYLLNKRVTKNTTDRFNSLGSFSPFYKHQAPKSDHEFITSHRSRYPTVGRNFDYRNLKKQSNWCNFATEDAMDGLSTLSEESCSSSAVRGKTTQNSPLNSMARQSMRRYDSDFCSPDYGLRNTYAKETRCRNRDEIQQGESANGSGKYTRKSNSSRSKPAIYLNSTFQKKLEPHDGWFFEDGYHPGFSSFCQTMETDCAPDGKLWYEDPFDAFSVPKSSFQRSKHDLPVEYSRSGGSFFTEKLSFCQPYNGIDPYGSPVFSKVGFGPSKPDLSPGPEIESMHPGLSHVVGSHVKLPDLSSQESFNKDGENESTFVLTACQTSELEKESIGNNGLSSEIEKPVENASDSKDNGSECKEVKDGTLELRESKLTDSPVHTDDTSSTVKIPSESESSTDEKEYQNDTQIQSQEGNKEIGDCGLEERKKASERQNASGNPSHHVMMFESYVLQYLCVQKVLKEASSHDTLKKV